MRERAICVEKLMTKDVKTCHTYDRLNVAAKLMWDHDCGCAPVEDEGGKVIGILTDRDICMAAYTQNRPLSEISVGEVITKVLYTCEPADTLEIAEEIMQAHQVRRLPVLGAGGELLGLLSLTDLARAVGIYPQVRGMGLNAEAIETTLAMVCRPRESSMQDEFLEGV